MPTVTELELFAVELPFKVAFQHAAAADQLRAPVPAGPPGQRFPVFC
jgi:hypothetical protein